MKYRVKNGKIISKKGIPNAPRWITDGRLALNFDERGIIRIENITSRNCDGNHVVFKRGTFNAFRCYIEKDRLTYSPEYTNVELMPYSVSTEWVVNEDTFRYQMSTVNQALYLSIKSPKALANGNKFKMNIYKASEFIPAETGDFDTHPQGMIRKWNEWEKQGNMYIGGFSERKADNDKVGYDLTTIINSNAEYTIIKSEVNDRTTLIIDDLQADRDYFFVINFENSKNKAIKGSQDLVENYKIHFSAQERRYKKVIDLMPKVKCKDKNVADFLSITPLYHESLKTVDFKGACKANTSRYWVWGWDTKISNYANFCWGDLKYLKQMLKYCRDTADDELGIFHANGYDNVPMTYEPAPSQGTYVHLLDLYYQFTGDIETIKEFYPFAKKVFEIILKTQTGMKGFFKGVSLFPDFPKCLKENGNDISLFNNTVCYTALRSMENLANLVGDVETAKLVRELFTSVESQFESAFYNKESGFFVNSLDATTFERRESINICGFMWDSEYCADLMKDMSYKTIDFIKENGLSPAGIKALPEWTDGFDGDANQLHCTWQVVEEYILAAARRTGNQKVIDDYMQKIGYWTSKMLAPEGISYFIQTATPELDNWNCESGTFQAYTMRKWYTIVIKYYLGLYVDFGGITVNTNCLKDYTLTNLNVLGKKVNIKTVGDGALLDYIEVNGEKIIGTAKVSLTEIEGKKVDIVIHKTNAKNKDLRIVSFVNGKIDAFEYNNESIVATVSGFGSAKMTVSSTKDIEVLIDGKKVEIEKSDYVNEYEFKISLEPNKAFKLEIKG